MIIVERLFQGVTRLPAKLYRVALGSLVSLFLLPSAGLFANAYQFRQVAAINAISQSTIFSMVQDSAGFLWIGTKDGLNRFDGYEFVPYKYDPFNNNTLSSNEIISLAIQSDLYLWAGTRSGGINRVNLKNGDITRFMNLSFDNQVHDIHVGSDNTLWVATSEGLLRFVEGSNINGGYFQNVSRNAIFRLYTNEAFKPVRLNKAVTAIFQHQEGQLLVGASEGLYEFDIASQEFRVISPEMFALSNITRIIPDSRGNFWVASYEGLVRLAPKFRGSGFDFTFFTINSPGGRALPVDWVETIAEDHQGVIWVGTRGAGLLQIKDNKVHNISKDYLDANSGLRDNIINSLFIDRTGVLWIGTESNGLVFSDLHAKHFYSLLPATMSTGGLSDNLVTAITGSGNYLWVGTASAGIDKFAINGERLSKITNIPRVLLPSGLWKSEIIDLLYDSDDILWIGSSTNSLVRYTSNEGFKNYVVNGFVYALLEDGRGNIWFGTWGQGIGYIDKSTGAIEQFNETPERMLGLSSDKILSIFLDSRGYLWVGTKGGGVNVAKIEEVISRSGRFTVYRHQAGNKNSLSFNDVYDIHEDLYGNIWFATGMGLNQLVIPPGLTYSEAVVSGLARFKTIGENEGMPGGLIYTIRPDSKGYLWLGTNNGLARYSPTDGRISVFDANDGLPSGKFNLNSAFYHPDNGYMFFGGVDGLTYFRPDSIALNPFDANVKITGIRVHNRPVLPTDANNGREILERHIFHSDKLRLAHAENHLALEFSALHFSSPGKVRYAHRLLGFNDEWQETGSENRRATFTNLPPGEYTFQVRATNNDGIWSPVIDELVIKIAPPIWLTTWAYIFYFALFMFLLYIFRRYSLIAIKKKNQLIIESLEHRKDVEIAQSKMRFFTNVSHEIRTPLTLIHAPLHEMLSREDLPGDVKEWVVMMNRNMKRLLTQVNQLLELRKMENGQYKLVYSDFLLEDLVRKTLLEFDAVIRSKKIVVNTLCKGGVFIRADQQLIGTVIYNLVSNSLKFTPPNGELTIEVECNEGNLPDPGIVTIKVSDTGPGIPEEDINLVFDRFFQSPAGAATHLGGSGLGLSIVKEFTEMHGGKVSVRNLPRRGCCFEVTLPVKTKVNDLLAAPRCSISYTNSHPASIQSPGSDLLKREKGDKAPRLYVVEDDVDMAVYLKNAFSESFDVSLFFDGNEGYEAILANEPDILLCDVVIPGISGVEITSRLKTNPDTSHIPVILMTARIEEENVVDGYRVGADSYIAKPFSINVLQAQVESVLQSREAFRNRFSKQMMLEPTQEVITPIDERFLRKLMEIVDANISNPSFEVSNLVDEMHMSHSIILKKVKLLTGMSPVEFIRSMRIKKAAQVFRQTRIPISEVAFMVGFSDAKYFSKCFSREMGMKPTEFIREQHG